MADIDDKKMMAIADMVKRRSKSYVDSQFYKGWKEVCSVIKDAVDQKYRPGEVSSRSRFYLGMMKAKRDSVIEGLQVNYKRAEPLIRYMEQDDGPGREFTDLVDKQMAREFKNMGMRRKWNMLIQDMVDFGMGCSYTSWNAQKVYAKRPFVDESTGQARLVLSSQMALLNDRAMIERIHPFNWRGDFENADQMRWQSVERQYNVTHLQQLLQTDGYNKTVTQKAIDRLKASRGERSEDFFSQADEDGSENELNDENLTLPGIEYWGDLNEVKGFESDPYMYQVIVIDKEVALFRTNDIMVNNCWWTPITRPRLALMNDFPIGDHILKTSIPHSKIKNLLTNWGIDQTILRASLGFAYKPDAILNPNDILNPEGAFNPIAMKQTATQADYPFFLNANSTVFNDMITMSERVVDLDSQKDGLNDQSLGLQGPTTANTATQANILANEANEKMTAMISNANDTGLEPMAKDITIMTIAQKNDEAFGGAFDVNAINNIWENNWWYVEPSVLKNPELEAMKMERAANLVMQHMANITPTDGGADHLTKFMGDYLKRLGIEGHRIDEYFPERQVPQVQTQPPQAPPVDTTQVNQQPEEGLIQ